MSLKFEVATEKDVYELSELSKMFGEAPEFCVVERLGGDKNEQKRRLYKELSALTGKTLDWGILIGVRPLKLYRELTEKKGREKAEHILKEMYLLSDEKLDLLHRTYDVQMDAYYDPNPKSVSLYVGIPFCPTRCLYCSFTSNKFEKVASQKYISALCKEIDAVKKIFDEKGMYAESIYIGGGTPTSLDDEEFEILLSSVRDAFKSPKCREWTVEAGRPDTITANKLSLIHKYGADRISINPQTMKQHTLDLIGRSHSPEQIFDAFKLAKAEGIENINADLITGLPEETPDDFENSLKTIIDLGPTNITVHTLAVKRASRLIDEDPDIAFRQADTVRKMLEISQNMLKNAGFKPYYLYRQKHMTGNFENVGYCTNGHQNVYNIRIMDENQSNIALGAGGISKIYFPDENRLERVPNVSNYEVYIDRIDEMINRKEKGIL